MKILLLGKDGQVGWELQRALAPLGEVVALGRGGRGGSGDLKADFSEPESLGQVIRTVEPQLIVNAAAYTAVDKAESDREQAHVVNAAAPAVLAREAARHGAWLIHYSTDYVFNGQGQTPWTEEHRPDPLSVYGATKLEGEQSIVRSGCRHLIFRTSWVYAARGSNFAKTMLRLAQERDQLAVINDQFGAPTGADLLADLTAHAWRTAQMRPEVSGTYHAAAAGHTHWQGYARHVIEFARAAGQPIRVADDQISAVPTASFPTPAKRPANSRLDTTKLQRTFGVRLPPWEQGVERMLTELFD